MPMQDDMKTQDKQSVVNSLTYLLEPVRNNAVDPIELTVGEYRIGTSKSCEICLDAVGVASEHCRIVCDHGFISLQSDDVRTWLNDGLVKKARINVGDRLTIGPISFLFRTRVGQPSTEKLSEDEENQSIRLARKLPEAIQAGRIDRSAERLANPVLNSTDEKSSLQAIEELHQSLHSAQRKFESQREALSYQPNRLPELPKTEFISMQKHSEHSAAATEVAAQPSIIQSRMDNLSEREQTIEIRKEQILRLTKKMSQRRVADEAALEKARQELEARHLELNTRAHELDQWEQAIENNQRLEQREDKERISELNSTIDQLQDQAEQLGKVRRLEQEAHAIQLAKREAEQSRLAEYERRIQEADEQLRNQAQQIELESAKNQSQAELIENQSEEIESLQLENSRLQELESSANQDIQKFEQQIARQLEQMQEVNALVEELQSQQDIAEQTALEGQKVKEELQQVQQQLAEESQSHQKTQEQLQDSLDHLASTEALSQQMTEELTESLKQQEELLSLNIELQASVEESQAKWTETSEELQRKLAEIDSSSERNAELTQTIQKLEHQRETLQAESDLARQKANALEEQLQEMTSQLEQKQETSEAVREEAEALKAMIAEFEQSRENYQAETDELLTECENLREQYTSLHAEHLGLQEEVQDLQARLKSSEGSSELNEELEAEMQALRSDIAELERTSSDQQDLLESTSEELEHLRNKQEQYDQMRAELDQEWDKLSQERDRLLEVRQNLEHERDAFRQSRFDLDQLRQEVAEQQIDSLNSTSQDSVIDELHRNENEEVSEPESFTPSADVTFEEILPEQVEEIQSELNEVANASNEEPKLESEADELNIDNFIGESDKEDDSESTVQEIDFAESVKNALATPSMPHGDSEDNSGDVRKRIAEMFGLIDDAAESSDAQTKFSESIEEDDLPEEEAAEEFHLEDEDEVEESLSTEEPEGISTNSKSQETIDAIDDIEDADSVAAYMERLFARTSGKQQYENPKPIEKPVVKPASAPKSIDSEAIVSSTEEASINIYPDKSITPQKSKGPIAKIDRDAVMREIASLRDVANQTARSALITHKWKHLKLKVYLNSTLTGIAALGTIFLLAAPLWHGDQFLMYAGAMGAVTIISGYSLLQNYVTFKRMKNPIERQKNSEADLEQQESDQPCEELES
ncbi:MAG TPA: hypothetical protein DD473_01365 [Planctomycetaceae bacterium]|nr:hypothetical protein [Planctomycetaceae bacterium]